MKVRRKHRGSQGAGSLPALEAGDENLGVWITVYFTAFGFPLNLLDIGKKEFK